MAPAGYGQRMSPTPGPDMQQTVQILTQRMLVDLHNPDSTLYYAR